MVKHKKSSADRDPMLHRPDLWEPLGLSPDTAHLIRQWNKEATILLQENSWSDGDLNAISDLASVSGRLQRANVKAPENEVMQRIEDAIHSLTLESREAATRHFSPSAWMLQANQIAESTNIDEAICGESFITDFLRQLDDAELANAVLLDPEPASLRMLDLEDCHNWVIDNFSYWCSAIPWVICMAEAISLPNDSSSIALQQSASKFMLLTEQISIAVKQRETVFGVHSKQQWNDVLFQMEIAEPSTSAPDVIRHPKFGSQHSNEIQLSLSAGTESSETLRKRIEGLPTRRVNVTTVDVGNAGVMTIQKEGDQYRCHFRTGVALEPPSVSIRQGIDDFHSVDWHPFPSGSSFQTLLFTAVEVLFSLPERELIIQLSGDEQ